MVLACAWMAKPRWTCDFLGDNQKNDDCELPLNILHILIYGKSWYNQHLFFSDTYEAEIKHNNKLRLYSFEKFLGKIIQIKQQALIRERDSLISLMHQYQQNDKTLKPYQQRKAIQLLGKYKSSDELLDEYSESIQQLTRSKYTQEFTQLFSDCASLQSTVSVVMSQLRQKYIKR